MSNKVKDYFRPPLLQAQKYIKADTIYLARGSFWSSTTFILSSILSLLLVLGFGNLLPKETYGTYKYLLSLAGTLGFLLLTGINTAVTQSTARGNIGALKFAVKVQLRWNFLFTLGIATLATYYAFQGNDTFVVPLLIIGFALPFTNTFNTYAAFLNGKKDFKTIALYSSASTLTYTLAMFGVLLITDNLLALIITYALANLIPMAYFFFKTYPRDQGSLTDEQKKELIQYTKHLSFINIFSTLSQYVDKIVIFHYLGAIQLATYGFALAMPERIRGYLKNITGLILPKLSEKETSEIKPVFYYRIFQAAFLGLLISISYVLISPFIFHFLLPQYLDAMHYSQVISIGFIFLLPASYIAEVFHSQKMIRAIYFSSITAHVSRIILYLILGVAWGSWGVIIATVGIHAMGLFFNIYLWERFTR